MSQKEFPKGISLELITKYFAGECSAKEINLIKSWILLDVNNEKLLSSFKKLWDAAALEDVNVDINAAWENFCKRVDLKSEINQYVPIPVEDKLSPYRLVKRIAGIAALILIMVGGLLLLKESGIFNNRQNLNSVWNERITHSGEKSIIKFYDGTQITLNANSKLRYPANFTNNKREVYLDGEAFFEVAHDSSRPFIVYCNNISTTVLGTKFNISAYSTEKIIAISLVEGNVKVSKNEFGNFNKLTMLKPDQQFLYCTTKNTFNVKDFDIEEITGWKDNLLKFKDETLGNVFVRLERSYGVKFELVPKSFNNYLITTNFQKASLLTVAEAIKKLTGLKYQIIKENDQVKEIVYSQK
jgi:ferric-dicitrate binding protein FerR (iron transport regulator)